ncbi:hypothetical protein Leryth_011240 [Lithospermum erythrorhizon]|nr:hypothetical protein Leryth_011240 [Lithospermum erythrorhizon]
MVRAIHKIFNSVIRVFTYCFFYQDNHHHYHHQDNKLNHRKKKIVKKARPLSLQTVELKVRMCCIGCERVVKEAIHKLRGVDCIEVDLDLEKVKVIGYVDRNKVLKAVRRAGKRAEFWPYPDPPLYFTNPNYYFKDTTTEFKESYNYWRHGYNDVEKYGTIPISHRGDDKVSNLFNDDNVNAACCVM